MEPKYRLPRKLKKGCRTLNGNPRTKWQRKGRLHIAKTLQQVADTACAAALGMDLLRQAVERIHPVTFPSGGIVLPPRDLKKKKKAKRRQQKQSRRKR